jgi:hypothetical protein
VKLKNAGIEADEGYECVHATLCAECAEGATIDGMPFLTHDIDEWHKGELCVEKLCSYNYPEVDAPIHCEECGALLPCSLTTDGMEYVRDQHKNNKSRVTKLWRRVFSYAFN